MIRRCTIIFLLQVTGLVADVAADQTLLQTSLQQTLTQLGASHCPDLAQLRSTDINGALNELYQAADYQSIWQSRQRLTELQAELGKLSDDGLNPGDYSFALHAAVPDEACEELRISADFLLALEHLSRGRLQQSDHETLWQAEAPPSFSPAGLALAGQSNGIASAFDQARPGLPLYLALRAAYAAMDKNPAERGAVPSGALIRPGMRDDRIEQIARQLHQDGFISQPLSNGYYDEQLVEAVRQFQLNQGLIADGVIGPQTLRALNTTPAQRLRQVQINLERLRWVNALRRDYLLLVNTASGTVQLMRGNRVVWQARAQTGRASRPTPALVSTINRITLNPSWTVPPTIMREDILPQIRLNPDYLNTHGMQTLDEQGQLIDPKQVNWNNPRGVLLRQPPGPTNPLGQIVFRLPNPYSVFLHDTPGQHLFEQPNRNLSSGCVRVQEAHGLAEQLLANLPAPQRELIAAQLASGQTHEIAIADGPQVILAYWTAYADAEGNPAFVPDVYQRDPALLAAMAGKMPEELSDNVAVVIAAESGCAFSEV